MEDATTSLVTSRTSTNNSIVFPPLLLRQFFHFVLILFLQITCRRDKRFVILINPLPITEHFTIYLLRLEVGDF